MSMTQEISQMVDLLPEQDQNMIYELVKKFVLAWDPDFTQLTPQEEKDIENAKNELSSGEYTTHDELKAMLGL